MHLEKHSKQQHYILYHVHSWWATEQQIIVICKTFVSSLEQEYTDGHILAVNTKKDLKTFCWCEMVLAHAGWRRNSWRNVFCLSKLLSISCRRSCCVWEYTNSWFFRPLSCKWHSVSDGACYCMTGLLVVHCHAQNNVLLTSVEVGAHTCFAGGWYIYVSEECVWAPPITARWYFECGQCVWNNYEYVNQLIM